MTTKRESAGPLSGITIIDFTWIGAGSFTTKLFADFGADVIKIESADRLDSLREARPFKDGRPGVNRSGYFADRNSSKRSITLNLKSPEALSLALDLIKGADVVANNFTPGAMDRLGLGYPAVRDCNPSIVYLAMSMQGDEGPHANYLGYGLTMGALTGLQHLCGLPGRPPAGTGTNFPDHIPNPTHAAIAVLSALRHRRRTGKGQYIDLAQIEPMIALLGLAVCDYTANGRIGAARGNVHEPFSPHGVYPCAGQDRWIALSAKTDHQWYGLQAALGNPAVLRDSEYGTPALRLRNRTRLDHDIACVTRDEPAQALMERAQTLGVPAGLVQDAADVLRHDPQLAHRDHWRWLDHPEMGVSVYSAPPMKLSRTPGDARFPAPLLGQHTDEILKERLKLSDARIADLRGIGALR
ncbi:CoA transferase [Achromobacter pestifer]|uniref:CoA transferase n=1 Tax=Achromobacter pestifer TaxID=1353889 RepID=A0A7D4HW81_9BURK|nr:CoA transferase [Achromobacter pestifer]QKH34840.1 CoA transferase [Achromobacter pestifer]